MIRHRVSFLAVGAVVCYAAFAVVLATRIAGRPFVPSWWLVPIAGAALVLTLALAGRTAASIFRGPRATSFASGGSARCEAGEAELVRGAATRRDATGGCGHVRPVLRAVPALALASVAAALSSGLLNVMLRVEGTWIQYASSGRDLDLLGTYRDLSLGTFADPTHLRYGILVGDVRPGEPDRVADVQVVDPDGTKVGEFAVGFGKPVSIADLRLSAWAVGPGARVTLVHQDRGQVFDQPFPLWPTGRPGEYAERVEADGLVIEARVDGWPWPDGESRDPHVVLRSGAQVLFDGAVKMRQVYRARDGYALVPWETRPYVGLGIAHRTYRELTIVSLSLAALFLLAWPLLRARPFWYREEGDGAISIRPPSALAALRRSRR